MVFPIRVTLERTWVDSHEEPDDKQRERMVQEVFWDSLDRERRVSFLNFISYVMHSIKIFQLNFAFYSSTTFKNRKFSRKYLLIGQDKKREFFKSNKEMKP